MLVKRKLNIKSLGDKYQTLKDLESGLSNKEVAKKYGVPENTISTWTKNKTSYFAALEQSSSKRKKLRDSDYERLDHVVLRWFLSQRSENIPADGVFIKEKTYDV